MYLLYKPKHSLEEVWQDYWPLMEVLLPTVISSSIIYSLFIIDWSTYKFQGSNGKCVIAFTAPIKPTIVPTNRATTTIFLSQDLFP